MSDSNKNNSSNERIDKRLADFLWRQKTWKYWIPWIILVIVIECVFDLLVEKKDLMNIIIIQAVATAMALYAISVNIKKNRQQDR